VSRVEAASEALMFDWATAGERIPSWPPHVMLYDETLRDGLQSPSVIDPPIEEKIEILHLMERLGIDCLDVGLPGAGERQRSAVVALCREIARAGLKIRPSCAARTVRSDIEPIAEAAQRSGIAIEAMLFIGSSPIRQYTEGWTVDFIVEQATSAIAFARAEGLEVTFVTEDTTRSTPEQLRIIFSEAIAAGARRLCLCDTCGAAMPAGSWNLVRWTGALAEELGAEIGIDWHGHRDRGLDLANSLAAIEAGATRIHGTALGIGERVGNTPLEQLLVNLNMLGIRQDDLSCLTEYTSRVAAATGVPLSASMPIVGRDAFRTGTGVHAAAVIKAMRRGDAWLADRVYSAVPARAIGRTQQIEIGPMSGASNVVWYLAERGWPGDDEIVREVLAAAKSNDRLLTEEEVVAVVTRCSGDPVFVP
jgi:2-isopropylmalate synthase